MAIYNIVTVNLTNESKHLKLKKHSRQTNILFIVKHNIICGNVSVAR